MPSASHTHTVYSSRAVWAILRRDRKLDGFPSDGVNARDLRDIEEVLFEELLLKPATSPSLRARRPRRTRQTRRSTASGKHYGFDFSKQCVMVIRELET